MSSGTVRYRRVATHDETDREERKKKRAELVDRISTKLQAVFWVGLAGFVTYFTDLPKKIIEHDDIDRISLNIAIVCLAVNTCLMVYLTVYIPYLERQQSRSKGHQVKLPWEIYCPKVIPTMTVLGITFFITFTKAIWPVFGFLSPLIVIVLFMGFLFLLHFIPSW